MSILVQLSAKLRVNVGRYEIVLNISVVWPCVQVLSVLTEEHSHTACLLFSRKPWHGRQRGLCTEMTV